MYRGVPLYVQMFVCVAMYARAGCWPVVAFKFVESCFMFVGMLTFKRCCKAFGFAQDVWGVYSACLGFLRGVSRML